MTSCMHIHATANLSERKYEENVRVGTSVNYHITGMFDGKESFISNRMYTILSFHILLLDQTFTGLSFVYLTEFPN